MMTRSNTNLLISIGMVVLFVVIVVLSKQYEFYRAVAPSIPEQAGSMCGGIAGLSCDKGYTCVYEPGSEDVTDASGSCLPIGS